MLNEKTNISKVTKKLILIILNLIPNNKTIKYIIGIITNGITKNGIIELT